MICAETSGWCIRCQRSHPASYHHSGDRINYRLSCPDGDRTITISHDAELWLRSRNRDPGPVPKGNRFGHVLEITHRCNRHCPICYAEANADASFCDIEAIFRRAKELRVSGLKTLCLSGGEALLHPHIITIVQRIRQIGLRCSIASNGLLLASHRQLAVELKHAGLNSIALQCDALDAKVMQRHRGHRERGIVYQALANCIRARLPVNLHCTVTRANVQELPKILRLAQRCHQVVTRVSFQAASAAGRFALQEHEVVCRDTAFRACEPALPAQSALAIRPLPAYRPWGFGVHPDCSVMLPLIYRQGTWQLLDSYLDQARWQSLLRARAHGPAFWQRNGIPLWRALRSLRPGGLTVLVRILRGFVHGKSLQLLLFNRFGNELHQDLAILNRCGFTIHDVDGGYGPACAYRCQEHPFWHVDTNSSSRSTW